MSEHKFQPRAVWTGRSAGRRDSDPELSLPPSPALLLVAQRTPWLPRPLVVAGKRAVGAFTSRIIFLSLSPGRFVEGIRRRKEPIEASILRFRTDSTDGPGSLACTWQQ